MCLSDVFPQRAPRQLSPGGRVKDLLQPSMPHSLAWVPPESQLQRDRCGARGDPLSVEQLIDDQPEFGVAALRGRLRFAHLIGRGWVTGGDGC